MPSPVDGNIHSSADGRWQKLVNCCKDGSKLSPNANTSEKPAKKKEWKNVAKQAADYSYRVNEKSYLDRIRCTMKTDLRP